MAPQKPPLPFNPSAAILLDQATFTITVNLRTGQMQMTTTRPDLNFLAVCDMLATQIQSILRNALAQAAAGKPGFVPPEDGLIGGGKPNGKPEGTS